MRRSLLPLVLGGVAFATVFAGLGQRDAHAARYYYAGGRGEGPRGDQGVTLDVDGDLIFPVANSYIIGPTKTTINPFNTGFGVDARLGFRAGGGLVFVQPELEGGLKEFEWVNHQGFVKSGASVGQFMAGARLGGRGIFEPQAFAHIGYGAGADGLSGFTYDLGGALNLRFRRVTFGAQLGWNQMIGANPNPGLGKESLSVKWLNAGLNAGVIF